MFGCYLSVNTMGLTIEPSRHQTSSGVPSQWLSWGTTGGWGPEARTLCNVCGLDAVALGHLVVEFTRSPASTKPTPF